MALAFLHIPLPSTYYQMDSLFGLSLIVISYHKSPRWKNWYGNSRPFLRVCRTEKPWEGKSKHVNFLTKKNFPQHSCHLRKLNIGSLSKWDETGKFYFVCGWSWESVPVAFRPKYFFPLSHTTSTVREDSTRGVGTPGIGRTLSEMTFIHFPLAQTFYRLEGCVDIKHTLTCLL